MKISEKFREFFARDYNFSHDNNNNNLFQKKKDDKLHIEGNDNVVADSLPVTLHTKRSVSIVLRRFEATRNRIRTKKNETREKKARCVSAGVQNPLCEYSVSERNDC